MGSTRAMPILPIGDPVSPTYLRMRRYSREMLPAMSGSGVSQPAMERFVPRSNAQRPGPSSILEAVSQPKSARKGVSYRAANASASPSPGHWCAVRP